MSLIVFYDKICEIISILIHRLDTTCWNIEIRTRNQIDINLKSYYYIWDAGADSVSTKIQLSASLHTVNVVLKRTINLRS
jgi:hypothetical protein